MKPVLWITCKLPEEVVAPLKEWADVRQWPTIEKNMPHMRLQEVIKEATIIWTIMGDQMDRELLASAPNLKLICNLAVGYNNIDLVAAKELGIAVTNTPGVLTDTTADLAFTLMLTTARRIVEASDELRSGQWTYWGVNQLAGMDVFGATLGIIGMGRIGEAVAQRAKGFDMDVIYHNRNRRMEAEEQYGVSYRQLDHLLSEADFIIVLTPLTAETKGLIGSRELALMKSTATIINVARGGIVQEDALYEALLNNDIWAASSDVFEQEPVSVKHPLLTLKNFVATPHIGSATLRTRKKMMEMNIQSMTSFYKGEPIEHRII
ncbi:2-hydroxyacid dehydrogenase [Kurthia sibirica]|uniref:D-glycerate dehydrogenase n=1 Tax=Kurthia sibirica TaxID=202750 RepID=A0A2U3APX4_9BACL|nr:D-glycerate dehydrogenase [Kurthia sibirica]PWI26574.1 D-glycerate dehydrogenase [Kurthia sibirica]GEK32824.1 D-glycerate dehydrogenase [Kurthia sibirica]